MKYILLDTNIILYREGESKMNEEMQTLTRVLRDSTEYKLCIHPLSIKEFSNHKIEEQKEAILSKLNAYKTLVSPPKVSDDFLVKCGYTNKAHDYIDISLLYAIERHCASYLITNDKKIKAISSRIGLGDKVLTIIEAISLFSNIDNSQLQTPVTITEVPLYSLDINDPFFASLREDYFGFDNWFSRKQEAQEKAYVSFLENDLLGSFLMMKIEDETEDYSTFTKPFPKTKRIKISTFKVADQGKSIGEAFIKISIDYALRNNIKEIYLTVFDKQKQLINLIEEYGFEFYTHKKTKKQDLSIEMEAVYVKKLNKDCTEYPIIHYKNQPTYIVPIQNQYTEMLFPDVFETKQISIYDLLGTSTYSNVIKKVYICNSPIKKIKNGDILVFYSSINKKQFVCIGVVDDAFRAHEINNFDEFNKLVKRRTVFEENYLIEAYNKNRLIILFKYYTKFNSPVNLNVAINKKIITSAPQSIQSIPNKNFKKLIKLTGTEKQIKI